MIDYYAVLMVDEKADEQTLRAAFRRNAAAALKPMTPEASSGRLWPWII